MMLEGKTVIVAGGARDIGGACAVRAAAQGANVVIGYHASSKEAAATVAKIEAAGGRCIAVQADFTKAADIARLVDATRSVFGDTIHVLMHVTGGLVARRTLAEMDEAFWHQVMDLNLTSLFLACKAVVPHMPAGGAIVTFASLAGRDGGGPGAIAYATSKGAVMSFTRGLAKELGPKVRVNALCPGMIATTFHDTFSKPEVRQRVAGMTVVKREGRSEEVADLACYLASDASSYVSGACIDINGGLAFS